MLVSLLRIPSMDRTVPRIRSRSGRVSTPISAMRSQAPLVVCRARIPGMPRRRVTTAVVVRPAGQLDGHQRPDMALVDVRPDAHREAQDDALGDQPVQPVLRGAAGYVQGRG